MERSHRQDDEELFHWIKPYKVAELNKLLESHCEWKSSDEFLTNHKNKIEKWIYKNGESLFQIQAAPETAEECVSSDKKAA